MDASWLHRYHLIGDEDCGVGIECRDHFDGGRPLAYYDRTGSKSLDPAVQNVSTIAGLLAAAEVHEHEKHGQPAPTVVNVHVQGSGLSQAELHKAIAEAVTRNRLPHHLPER